MDTQCNQESLQFHPLFRREVRGQFDGGTITSDAGGLLLREVEKRTGIVAQFAACFRDHRKAERIEHPVKELVAQRVYGLALLLGKSSSQQRHLCHEVTAFFNFSVRYLG